MLSHSKKYCKNGCSRFVFAHGLCLSCYKKEILYPKQKLKERKHYTIKPYSSKREKINRIYTEKKKKKWEQLIAEKKNYCYFTKIKLDPDILPDFHHTLGRDGDLLTDMEYAFPCTFKAHREYHDLKYDYDHLERIKWYYPFLKRLEKENPILYYQEFKRIQKANGPKPKQI